MSARTFADIYFHMQCRDFAREALRPLRGQESPAHPSAAQVDQVLAGATVIVLARNGYVQFRAPRTGRKDA